MWISLFYVLLYIFIFAGFISMFLLKTVIDFLLHVAIPVTATFYASVLIWFFLFRGMLIEIFHLDFMQLINCVLYVNFILYMINTIWYIIYMNMNMNLRSSKAISLKTVGISLANTVSSDQLSVFPSPLTCGDRVISVSLGQYYGCWCPGSLRRQGISSHDIDYVE